MDHARANEIMEGLQLAALKAGGSFHKVRYVPAGALAACSIQMGPIAFEAVLGDRASGTFGLKGPVRWSDEWSERMGSVFVECPRASADWMAWASRGIELAGKGRETAWENR